MSATIQRFYDRVSFIYPLLDLFIRGRKKQLMALLDDLPAGDLLEVGVGNGSHLKWYGTKHTITGIDLSAGMLEVARKRGVDATLLEMNAEALTFDAETFDYVIVAHIVAVVPHPEKILQEAFRVLKPGGQLFVLNHFTPKGWLGFVDRFFHYFRWAFRFRTIFHLDDLKGLEQFESVTALPMGRTGYFQLLVCKKPA